jgi:hypothetical protein
MSSVRRDQKRDANEPEIVDALEAVGCTVDRLPGGSGRPDLLVGHDGMDTKMEVKMPGEKMNSLQKTYHETWKGAPIHLVFNVGEALEIVAWKRKNRRVK